MMDVEHNADIHPDSVAKSLGLELFPQPVGVKWTVNSDVQDENGYYVDTYTCTHPHKSYASLLECAFRHMDQLGVPVYFRGFIHPFRSAPFDPVTRPSVEVCLHDIASIRQPVGDIESIMARRGYPSWLANKRSGDG